MSLIDNLLNICGDDFSFLLFLIRTAWQEPHFIVDEDNEEEAAQEKAAYEIYEASVRHNAENRRELAAYILKSAREGSLADLVMPLLREDLYMQNVDMDAASEQEIIAGIERLIAPRVWVRGKGYVIEE